MSRQEVGVSPQELLKKYFGYDAFRSGQEKVIDSLLAGRSALAVFPTGGGKSLCYQLPALALPGLTLVISPLIALMKDQIDYLTRRGVPAARLDSTLSLQEARAISDRMQSGELKLLYVAPERFNNERFLAQLARVRISLFAVDEAHCISEWGHNFRPDYLKLAEFSRDLGAERVLALTATATPQVTEDICKAFQIVPDDSIVTGFYRFNLRLATTPVPAERRDGLLLERLQKRAPGPTIIYVTLQKTAERVAEYLTKSGMPAAPYHAGMENEERERVQEEWMASDQGIVVATIAFGMGIDKSNVRYVYHYNLPKSLESYSQEIGRAGRDGQPSIVEMLACQDDVPTLENFVYGDTPTVSSLRALVTYLLSQGETFDVNMIELANQHDLRVLVLRTIMTYMELQGILKQGTPFYAGYEFRPREGQSMANIVSAFPGEPGRFVASVFDVAKKGRTWYSLNPDDAAITLGQERKRIVRSLEVLQEKELIELRVSDARNRYTRLQAEVDANALVQELSNRFLGRETAETTRIQSVLDLVTHDGCQTNALVGYFGEMRDTPCGHCTYCLTTRRMRLPPPRELPPIPADLAETVRALRAENLEALGDPRQIARFLCGLTSPALTRARLSRHELFGSEEARPFADVLKWAETIPQLPG